MLRAHHPFEARARRPPRSRRLNVFDIIRAPYDALNWLTDALFLALTALFEQFGAPIVFVAGLAEATIGLGVVFPGVVIMFLGGAAAAHGDTSVWLIFAFAAIGTAIGDTISYAAGRWGSRWLYQTRFGPSLRLGAALLDGRARWLIPFYHLHSMTRAVGPFGAGALRLPLRVWMPLDYTGALIANAVWVGTGFIFGTAVLTPEGTLEQHPALRLGLAASALTWFLLVRRVFQRRLATIRAQAEEPATT